VTLQMIASTTTNGTGSCGSNPVALNRMRASIPAMQPTRAQIIQEGKYEPRMLRDGEPLQPLISAAPNAIKTAAR
jgi:hypothetical protein